MFAGLDVVFRLDYRCWFYSIITPFYVAFYIDLFVLFGNFFRCNRWNNCNCCGGHENKFSRTSNLWGGYGIFLFFLSLSLF